MNFGMNRISNAVLACFVLLGTTTLGRHAEFEALDAARLAAKAGPEALLRHVRETGMRAPTIHSQWYVDRLAESEPERVEAEQAGREFGRSLLEALESTAPTLREPADSAARQAAAETLLDLADWFGEAPGYGNALIFSRLQDMATVPLAYLVADLSFPEAELAAMLDRLVDYPEEVRRNARVLNEESSTTLFKVPQDVPSCVGVWKTKDRERIVNGICLPLENAWNAGAAKVVQWQGKHGGDSGMPAGKQIRDAVPAELAFFVDDSSEARTKPATVLNLWDRKHHRSLFLGLGGHNIRDTRILFLFRQLVGGFPTEPPTWWQPGDLSFPTPGSAAFYVVWQPYWSEYGPQNGTAARMYEAVKNAAFYDEDTRRSKLHKALERNAGGGVGPVP